MTEETVAEEVVEEVVEEVEEEVEEQEIQEIKTIEEDPDQS